MGRELRLGILMGVTGQLSQLGPPIRDAAQLAVQQVNDADTEFSVDAQFEDTATDPNQGISGGEALVNAGYPAIAGALSSTVTIQVANNVTVPNEVVQCSPASTSPAITDLDDNDFVWRTPPTDALQGQVLAQVAQERRDASTAATMALNNDYGTLLAESFESAFEDRGGSITASVSFEPEQGSYTARLNEALGDGPDVLMIVGYPASGVQIFRDFYADYSDDDVSILVPDGLKDDDLPGDVGNDMSNVAGTAPLAAGPGVDFFTQLYEDAYDDSPAVFTAQSYDAAAVLMLANAAAGENSGSAIRDQMANVANPGGTEVSPENLVEGLEMAASGEEIQYSGASSIVDFDENGDISAATYEIFGFTSEGTEQVDTVEFQA
jgi:ABC-type branched-subunit amino acid transport system substrate-binding protein